MITTKFRMWREMLEETKDGGMRRMVKRGLITEKERILLTTSKVSATSRHNVILINVVITNSECSGPASALGNMLSFKTSMKSFIQVDPAHFEM